jgi:hypothetical protein
MLFMSLKRTSDIRIIFYSLLIRVGSAGQPARVIGQLTVRKYVCNQGRNNKCYLTDAKKKLKLALQKRS